MKILSRDDFKRWVSNTTGYFREGAPQTMTREFSTSLRPYDTKLADLYEKIADTHDEIAKHLLARTGDGR